MSFIRTKIIYGNPYLYEVESYREGKHVRQRHIRYIGRAGGGHVVTKEQIKPTLQQQPTVVTQEILIQGIDKTARSVYTEGEVKEREAKMRNNNEDSAQEITEMIHIKNTQDARMNRSEIRRQEIDKVLAEHFSEYHEVFGFEGDMNWSAQQQLSSSVTVQFDANKTNAILFLKMNPDDDLSITDIYVSK